MLGAAACGSDDDGGNDGGSASAAAKKADDVPTLDVESGSPEEAIQEAYTQFVVAMEKKDFEKACSLMTPKAQKETGAGMPCVKRFESFLKGSKPGTRSYLVDLKVNGNTAVAKAKTKTSDIYTVKWAKRDGQWKINGDEE